MKKRAGQHFGWNADWHNAHISHICRRLDTMETQRTKASNRSPKFTFTKPPFIRDDSNTLTAKKIRGAMPQSSGNKYRLIQKSSSSSKMRRAKTPSSGSKRLKPTSTLQRPKSASSMTLKKRKRRANHVKTCYINFVQMLAEHYSEEEYDAILKRVADEARLLQRQLVMEDYTGALKDGDAVPGPLVLSPSQSAQQQCERNQSQL